MSPLPFVLVTCATGSTSSAVVRALSASGKFRVRAAMRTPDKAGSLRQLPNVEIVQLDASEASAEAAFRGVDGVYLLVAIPYASDPHFAVWHKYIRQAKVKFILYHSALSAYEDTILIISYGHWLQEEALKASDTPYTILQCGFFHQNLDKYLLSSIRATSSFAGSATTTARYVSVDVRDIAAAAVRIFTEVFEPAQGADTPAPHGEHLGKTYKLTGEVVTEGMLASLISKASGREVKYEEWSVEKHKEKIARRGFTGDWAADLLAMDREKRDELYSELYPDLEQLLGRKPTTLEQYINDIAPLLARL